MNEKHGLAGLLGVLASGLISAFTPAIQAFVTAHPTGSLIAGTVVGVAASVLPSAVGLGTKKPNAP